MTEVERIQESARRLVATWCRWTPEKRVTVVTLLRPAQPMPAWSAPAIRREARAA